MKSTSQSERRGEGLRGSDRLKSDRDIREAYSQGKRWVGRTMVMWLREGENASLRVATVASRKTVGNAVARNRARRRLREAFRTKRHLFEGDVDVVLVARRRLNTADWAEIENEIVFLARRAGLIGEERK